MRNGEFTIGMDEKMFRCYTVLSLAPYSEIRQWKVCWLDLSSSIKQNSGYSPIACIAADTATFSLY